MGRAKGDGVGVGTAGNGFCASDIEGIAACGHRDRVCGSASQIDSDAGRSCRERQRIIAGAAGNGFHACCGDGVAARSQRQAVGAVAQIHGGARNGSAKSYRVGTGSTAYRFGIGQRDGIACSDQSNCVRAVAKTVIAACDGGTHGDGVRTRAAGQRFHASCGDTLSRDIRRQESQGVCPCAQVDHATGHGFAQCDGVCARIAGDGFSA